MGVVARLMAGKGRCWLEKDGGRGRGGGGGGGSADWVGVGCR